jgi:hypothetical protein
MPQRPTHLTIRSYQVGFGDCFLLSFDYPGSTARHVLIDFGTTAMPASLGTTSEKQMLAVANDIAAVCRKLDVVVATHRHKDHIGGFATKANGRGPGDAIRALKPAVVVQPWTEHPKAKTDATRPPTRAAKALVKTLADMQGVAAYARNAAAGVYDASLREQLSFLGENNLKNASAVKNLMTLAPRTLYAHAGQRLALGSVLPGVRVRVLGPPTLEQSAKIRKQRTRDKDEFWHLQRKFWSAQHGRVRATNGRPLFPRAPRIQDPVYARWMRRQLADANGDSLLQIVRVLDRQMNNTSLILLFEAGKKRLLFPGDAQIENWEFALANQKWMALLKGVDVYKVGHHGSLNATPKSLFANFSKVRPRAAAPLLSLLSTLAGEHGDDDDDTEVPRRTLVTALQQKTQLHDTQRIGRKLCQEIGPIALG